MKVALRSDAAPISALNENYNWTGYCARTINALEDYLEIKLDRPHGIQVVKLPSDSKNSVRIINEGRAHLECGSNPTDSDTQITPCNRNSACNYRGMILPAGDRAWQDTIIDFLSSQY